MGESSLTAWWIGGYAGLFPPVSEEWKSGWCSVTGVAGFSLVARWIGGYGGLPSKAPNECSTGSWSDDEAVSPLIFGVIGIYAELILLVFKACSWRWRPTVSFDSPPLSGSWFWNVSGTNELVSTERGIILSTSIFSVAISSWPVALHTSSILINWLPNLPASFRSWLMYCWLNPKWNSRSSMVDGWRTTELPWYLANFSANVPGVVWPTCTKLNGC